MERDRQTYFFPQNSRFTRTVHSGKKCHSYKRDGGGKKTTTEKQQQLILEGKKKTLNGSISKGGERPISNYLGVLLFVSLFFSFIHIPASRREKERERGNGEKRREGEKNKAVGCHRSALPLPSLSSGCSNCRPSVPASVFAAPAVAPGRCIPNAAYARSLTPLDNLGFCRSPGKSNNKHANKRGGMSAASAARPPSFPLSTDLLICSFLVLLLFVNSFI